MERRQHERFRVQFEVRVTRLDEEKQAVLGRVTDASNSGLSIVLPLDLAPRDLVQLEMADSVLYAHVIHCASEGSGAEGAEFRIGVEVERVLLGTTELASLLKKTLIDVMPDTKGLEQSEVYSN
jgi:PilZ domain